MLPALVFASLLARQSPTFDIRLPLDPAVNSDWMLDYDITVNGKGPFLTDFDTGASAMVVSAELVKELGLVLGEKITINSVGSNQTSGNLTTIDAIGIGGITAPSTQALILSLPEWLPSRCILGAPLLSIGVIRVDLDKKELEFEDFDHFTPPAKADKVPLTFNGYRPIIEAKVEDSPCKLLVDTGSAGELSLNTTFTSKHQLATRTPRLQQSGQATMSGRLDTVTIRAKSIELDHSRLTSPITDLSLRAKDDIPDADGSLGLRILRRFNFAFDTKRGFLYLEPRANLHDPFVGDRAGLGLDPTDGTLRVQVVPGSPAAKAGVKTGDKLVEWEGKPVAMKDILVIAENCLGPIGSKVSFVVERGGKRIPFELTLKEVF